MSTDKPTYEFMAPARQPGYNAVYEVLEAFPEFSSDARCNAVVWRAVQAFADAMGMAK